MTFYTLDRPALAEVTQLPRRPAPFDLLRIVSQHVRT